MQFGYFSSTAYVISCAIILLAFAIRGMIGFGSGLISVSLLIFFLPIKETVPVVFLLGAVGALALGSYDFKEIAWPEMPWLWVFTILGLIAGALVLKILPAQSVTFILGIFILIYVLYASVTKPEHLPTVARIWGAPLGFLGGVIGSLYGGGGPSIVAYLQMRHLNKRDFRASFQFIAVTDALVRGVLYFFLGFLNIHTVFTALWLLPAVGIGLLTGNWLHFRIKPKPFQYMVLVVLAIVGLKLVIP